MAFGYHFWSFYNKFHIINVSGISCIVNSEAIWPLCQLLFTIQDVTPYYGWQPMQCSKSNLENREDTKYRKIGCEDCCACPPVERSEAQRLRKSSIQNQGLYLIYMLEMTISG